MKLPVLLDYLGEVFPPVLGPEGLLILNVLFEGKTPRLPQSRRRLLPRKLHNVSTILTSVCSVQEVFHSLSFL